MVGEMDPHDGMGMEGTSDVHGHEMYDEGEGDMMEEQEGDGINALNLQWVMGFNMQIDQGVHNLTTDERTEIFYSAAHTGIIYNYTTKTQKLLQGHCNKITCTACSHDKTLIVTADSGQDSMLVVWDAVYGTPKRTYFSPHENGVKAIDISPDSRYIVTLSNDE